MSSLPWVILGDFNDMLRESEKKGRKSQPNWLLSGFRDTMLESGVFNLPIEGSQFMCERRRGTHRWVQEKLDRVFVNEDWRSMFPTNRVQNLVAPSSDHSAPFLQVSVWRLVPRAFRFCFENSWLKEERCSEIVAECWHSYEGEDVGGKINRCATRLKEWGDKLAKKFKQQLGNCRKRID